jgi:hypothetical protein
VWDTRIGGIPVCLLGIESHKVPRKGFVPADGPPAWTAGTLFPHLVAQGRAGHQRGQRQPAAGGAGQPVGLRRLTRVDAPWQLEYGAEIGRAVTNFKGPIVFVVVSRYHGGAFVVFSKALNRRWRSPPSKARWRR